MMKKTFFTFVLFFVTITTSFSQTLVFGENFDSYSNGDKIAQVAGAPWTTWSNAPGGSEDGTVSNAQSVSASNSLNIVTNNDVIVDLGDLTTGRYRIDFDYYIAAGKLGYFNALQNFAGSSSKWGMQVLFNSDLTASVDAGGSGTATFNYLADTWMHIRMFVDLDNDLGTLLIDGEELVSWQWSTGAQGDGDLVKLDAIDFFGWSGKGAANYFVDNFELNSLPTLDAPTNLVAAIDANTTGIDLTWDAPATAPDYYGIIRNNKPYTGGISETSFNDTNLYPNTYTYAVGAFYNDLGYSPVSNVSDSVTIDGGVQRDLVLFEIGTGTNCPYCPGASMGTDDLLANGKDVAIIKYQTYSTNDPFYNGVGVDRATRYGLQYYPSTIVDGELRMEGGSATVSLYPGYLNFYNERITKPALYTIDATVTTDGEYNFVASITVDELSDYLQNPVKLYTSVSESHVQYNWGNQTEINHRCIGMYPNESGTALDFSTKSVSIDIPFTVDFNEDLTIEDYELVVFVQEDETNDIIQTIKFNLNDATVTNINEENSQNIAVYPNPAQNFVTVGATVNSIVEIIDLSGKVLITETLNNNNQSINIQSLNTGVYVVKVYTGDKISVKKLIVQ